MAGRSAENGKPGTPEDIDLMSPSMRQIFDLGGYAAVNEMVIAAWERIEETTEEQAQGLPVGVPREFLSTERTLRHYSGKGGVGWVLSGNVGDQSNRVTTQVHIGLGADVAEEEQSPAMTVNGATHIGRVDPETERIYAPSIGPTFCYPGIVVADFSDGHPAKRRIREDIQNAWANGHQIARNIAAVRSRRINPHH